MTADPIRITENTKVRFEPTEIRGVHLGDLEFVLGIEEGEDGEVEQITIDFRRLVQAMTLYSSMERFRYGWRRAKPAPGSES